ncbi:MAG: TolC family outer membrane protein [Pseudobdellovibrionaceae bacterium]|nr:TolC family outer membrane protein [Pseudobdellovibrionaceae bacterium]
MSFSYRNLLMVCACALGINGFAGSASAQDSSQAMENQMKTNAEALPVPEADMSASVMEAKQPPTPVLSSTSPETTAVAKATQVGSYNPRAVDRIITLRDAVGVGVLTNPQTETVQNNRRATDEELEQAKALYLPSVDLRADTGYQSIYSDPDGSIEGHSDLWRSQASLTLTQMLFDGMNTHYENERQRHRVRSASHRVRETAEFLGLDIVESYLDVLRQRELLAIAVENLNQHRSIMGQIEDSTGAGRSTQADVEQTKARVAAAVAQESAVRQSLRNAEATYRSLVGDLPQPDLTRPIAPSNMLEGNIDDEVKQVLTHSPTLDIKEADVNVAEAEWEQSKSTLYPQVDFQAGASIGDNLDGVEGRTQEASALLIANWNLYRGGGDEARIREHVYRHAQSKTDRNAAARSVESDVRQTWANMMAAGERAEAFTLQAEANAMVVQAYKDQFNLDRRTLLDVLDSQNEWFVSRSNAINNGYLEMFAVYRLLALRGVLLPTMGVPYPKEVNPADTSRG